jgi:hypothetical protein
MTSGHHNILTGVCVADECGVAAARSTTIVTCSLDGSVRLWGVDEAGCGDEECFHIVACSPRERLGCVASTPDALRLARPRLVLSARVDAARRGGVLLCLGGHG